jgi:hypothetical protein
MRHRRWPALVALFAGSCLAACASVQSESNFRPPPGWTGSPSLFGRVQVWTNKERGGVHTLMVVKGDSGRSDIFYNPQLALNTMHDVTHDTIKVCGGRTAEHYRGVKTNGAVIEGVAVRGAGRSRYAALYMRDSAKTPADPQAERALRSLCPAG